MQQQISEKKLREKIKENYEVLIESKTFDNKYLVGRTTMDVPEMDGLIYIKNDLNEDLINKFIMCKIVDIKDYDLIGEFIK